MTDHTITLLAELRQEYENHQAVVDVTTSAISEIKKLSVVRNTPGKANELREKAEFYKIFKNKEALGAIIVDASKHIDWLEGVITDLQSEDGGKMHREQGAAEERARIIGQIREFASRAEPIHAEGHVLVADMLEGGVYQPPLPDLLPPIILLKELEETKLKLMTARDALHANVHDAYVPGKVIARAREALKGTK